MSKKTAYIMNLSFNSKGLGGGSMELALLVDPVRKKLVGEARGKLEEGTEHPLSFSVEGRGHMHEGRGGIVGALHGEAGVSVAPPLIGTYLAPFLVSFNIEGGSGTGRFTVGDHSYECEVSTIN